MQTLKDFDKLYLKSLRATFKQLENSHQNIKNNYKFDLTKTEITEAILARLKAYYLTQGQIKTFLDKRYLTAGSDYFVEIILFFLRLYLQSIGGKLEAHSERQIKKDKNSIRPDISIWRQNKLIGIIECKTQLGWNRNNWEKEYLDRDLKLKIDFPKTKSFLLVMTGSNWGGFGKSSQLNKKYFCLLRDVWPSTYSSNEQILTPIENIFKNFT
ncbi:MAG: hypothetical protein ABI638_04290 [Ignavibacteriota bacterium]